MKRIVVLAAMAAVLVCDAAVMAAGQAASLNLPIPLSELKMDMTNLLKIPVGGKLIGVSGDFEGEVGGNSNVVQFNIPPEWSADGKCDALRVTGVFVEKKTCKIAAAMSSCVYPTVAEGAYALTNDVHRAVVEELRIENGEWRIGGAIRHTPPALRATSPVSGEEFLGGDTAVATGRDPPGGDTAVATGRDPPGGDYEERRNSQTFKPSNFQTSPKVKFQPLRRQADGTGLITYEWKSGEIPLVLDIRCAVNQRRQMAVSAMLHVKGDDIRTSLAK